MAYETVKIEKADGVALVSLNRPAKKNAMNPQLHADMTDALEELRYDDEARVLVITGAGDAFCAGMDLKEVFHALKDDPVRYDKVIRQATEWRGRTLRYFPKPTIAMVNGYCFGGAFSIVEGCDLAIAAEEASFGLSEINFKGFPGGAVSKSLANLLRPRDALFYGLTGRRFDGKTAATMGFVNFAVPLSKLKDETLADVALMCLAWQPDGRRPEVVDELLELLDAVAPFFDERVLYAALKEKSGQPGYALGLFVGYMEDKLDLERGRDNVLTPEQRARVAHCLAAEMLVAAAFKTYGEKIAADEAAGLTTSTSSSLTPTIPICGKVKVMIWAA